MCQITRERLSINVCRLWLNKCIMQTLTFLTFYNHNTCTYMYYTVIHRIFHGSYYNQNVTQYINLHSEYNISLKGLSTKYTSPPLSLLKHISNAILSIKWQPVIHCHHVVPLHSAITSPVITIHRTDSPP